MSSNLLFSFAKLKLNKDIDGRGFSNNEYWINQNDVGSKDLGLGFLCVSETHIPWTFYNSVMFCSTKSNL